MFRTPVPPSVLGGVSSLASYPFHPTYPLPHYEIMRLSRSTGTTTAPLSVPEGQANARLWSRSTAASLSVHEGQANGRLSTAPPTFKTLPPTPSPSNSQPFVFSIDSLQPIEWREGCRRNPRTQRSQKSPRVAQKAPRNTSSGTSISSHPNVKRKRGRPRKEDKSKETKEVGADGLPVAEPDDENEADTDAESEDDSSVAKELEAQFGDDEDEYEGNDAELTDEEDEEFV